MQLLDPVLAARGETLPLTFQPYIIVISLLLRSMLIIIIIFTLYKKLSFIRESQTLELRSRLLTATIVISFRQTKKRS